MMTLRPYQRNHKLQNYVYDNRNSFLVWRFFSLWTLYRWPDSHILLTGNSKTKERITLVSLQSSEAVRLKMSHSERKNELQAQTVQTNTVTQPTSTYLHLPLSFKMLKSDHEIRNYCIYSNRILFPAAICLLWDPFTLRLAELWPPTETASGLPSQLKLVKT